MSKKQNQDEINLYREENEHNKEKAEVKAAYTPETNTDNSIPKELQDEWEYLRSVAILQFPEGKDIEGLTPNQRLTAIAHSLGWSNRKIAKASGSITDKTVARWLKLPVMKLFIERFGLSSNISGDVMEELGKLEVAGVAAIRDIFALKGSEPALHRLKLDTFKALFDRTRGKAEQKHEINSNTILEFTESLQKMTKEPNFVLTQEDEEELFEPEELN